MVQLQEQGRYGAANAQLPGQGLDIKKTASAIGHAGGLTSDCGDVAVQLHVHVLLPNSRQVGFQAATRGK